MGTPQRDAALDREVTFRSSDGLELKGTFLKPKGADIPAVLLLPGSGPTDRNGNQPPAISTDLLKQIAESLRDSGIASLRFDKRAVLTYASSWPTGTAKLSEYFSWRHFTDDAAAGLRFLRTAQGVDPKRVGIIGHSEGSGLAIQIGKDSAGKAVAPKVLVLLGAPGRTLEPLIREQVAASLGRSRAPSDTIKVYMDYVDAALRASKENKPFPKKPPEGLAGLFNDTAASLIHSYLTLDPAKNIKSFLGPVLIVQGERDIQVSSERDTPLLEKALKSRGGVSEVFIVPGASHNLKLIADPNTDPGFAGDVAPAALEKMKAWLAKHL